jgi:hypothetical protein
MAIPPEEFKTVEGWADDDFPNRMADRVEFLRAHLPPFLVENSRIYSILSLGWILDEDKKKKEELQLRNSLKKAIAEFTPESPATKAPDIGE